MSNYIRKINLATTVDEIDAIIYNAAFDTRLSDARCHTVYVLARKKRHEIIGR